MIIMEKRGQRIKVPAGAKDRFENSGWSVVKTEAHAKQEKAHHSDMEDAKAKELEDMPVSEWSVEDVKFYADHRGLDVSTARSTKEAKAIVLNYLKAR